MLKLFADATHRLVAAQNKSNRVQDAQERHLNQVAPRGKFTRKNWAPWMRIHPKSTVRAQNSQQKKFRSQVRKRSVRRKLKRKSLRRVSWKWRKPSQSSPTRACLRSSINLDHRTSWMNKMILFRVGRRAWIWVGRRTMRWAKISQGIGLISNTGNQRWLEMAWDHFWILIHWGRKWDRLACETDWVKNVTLKRWASSWTQLNSIWES